jgi:hypothetical protein
MSWCLIGDLAPPCCSIPKLNDACLRQVAQQAADVLLQVLGCTQEILCRHTDVFTEVCLLSIAVYAAETMHSPLYFGTVNNGLTVNVFTTQEARTSLTSKSTCFR